LQEQILIALQRDPEGVRRRMRRIIPVSPPSFQSACAAGVLKRCG